MEAAPDSPSHVGDPTMTMLGVLSAVADVCLLLGVPMAFSAGAVGDDRRACSSATST
jgi:hypothetical protein